MIPSMTQWVQTALPLGKFISLRECVRGEIDKAATPLNTGVAGTWHF
jgi:hypothetical protein